MMDALQPQIEAGGTPRASDSEGVRLARAQVQALKKVWDREAGRRAQAERIQRIADGDWLHEIPAMPNEPPSHKGKKPHIAPNLLQFALDEIANLYDEEPAREMASEASQAWAQSALWDYDGGLSAWVDAADAQARLHGSCLLYLCYKQAEDAPRSYRAMLGGQLDADGAAISGDPGVSVRVIPRHRFAVLPNESDPTVPEAMVIHLGDDKSGKPRHHYWDRQHFTRLVGFVPETDDLDGEGRDFIEHPFSDYPIVPVRNRLGGECFDAPAWGGRDLADNLAALAGLLSEYAWTAKLQRGQPWATGAIKNFTLAPDALAEVEAKGKFDIASNGANLAGILAAVQFILELIARTLGLPSRTFKLEASSMSGIAIALDRAVLDRSRRAREKLARAWERVLHRKAADIWAAAQSQVDGTLESITYRPLPVFTTPGDRLARLKFEREEGVLSDEDLTKALHPGLDEDQIKARLERAYKQRDDAAARLDAEKQADAARQAEVARAGQPADPLADLLGPSA